MFNRNLTWYISGLVALLLQANVAAANLVTETTEVVAPPLETTIFDTSSTILDASVDPVFTYNIIITNFTDMSLGFVLAEAFLVVPANQTNAYIFDSSVDESPFSLTTPEYSINKTRRELPPPPPPDDENDEEFCFLNPTAIGCPEPGSLALLFSALVGMGLLRGRRYTSQPKVA